MLVDPTALCHFSIMFLEVWKSCMPLVEYSRDVKKKRSHKTNMDKYILIKLI